MPNRFHAPASSFRVAHIDHIFDFIARNDLKHTTLNLLLRLLAQITQRPGIPLFVEFSQGDVALLDQLPQRSWADSPISKRPVLSYGPNCCEALYFRVEIRFFIKRQRLTGPYDCAPSFVNEDRIEHLLPVLPPRVRT